MAIYKNREVYINHVQHRVQTNDVINIRHPDGMTETVPVGQVQFTEAEKKQLVKDFPSAFDNVNVISDEDVKAVRTGVAPSTDPSLKEQARTQVMAQKQAEESAKIQDNMRKQQEAEVNKQLNAPTDTTQSNQPKVVRDNQDKSKK